MSNDVSREQNIRAKHIAARTRGQITSAERRRIAVTMDSGFITHVIAKQFAEDDSDVPMWVVKVHLHAACAAEDRACDLCAVHLAIDVWTWHDNKPLICERCLRAVGTARAQGEQ